MKFKDIGSPIPTSDPWYDLFQGGYFKPEELLADQEEARKVREAMKLVHKFMDEMEDKGIIEIL